eukprot:473141_1
MGKFTVTLLILIFYSLTYSVTIDDQTSIFASNACFNAKTYDESTIFNAPKNGTLLGIKLHYLNGSVTCTTNSSSTYWGCQNNDPSRFLTFILRITDSSGYYGQLYYPLPQTDNATLTDYSGNENFKTYYTNCERGCVYNSYTLNNKSPIDSIDYTLFNPQYNVTTTDQFMVQFSEACCNELRRAYNNDPVGKDNAGTTCASVYFIYLKIPTNSPTRNPSATPTQNPTENPTKLPSILPTQAPFRSGLNVPETTIEAFNNTEPPKTQYSYFIYIYMGIAAAALCLICCFVIICSKIRKKRKARRIDTSMNDANDLQLTEGHDNATTVPLDGVRKEGRQSLKRMGTNDTEVLYDSGSDSEDIVTKGHTTKGNEEKFNRMVSTNSEALYAENHSGNEILTSGGGTTGGVDEMNKPNMDRIKSNDSEALYVMTSVSNKNTSTNTADLLNNTEYMNV